MIHTVNAQFHGGIMMSTRQYLRNDGTYYHKSGSWIECYNMKRNFEKYFFKFSCEITSEKRFSCMRTKLHILDLKSR